MNYIDLLRQEVSTGVDTLVEEAFSGDLGFVGKPAAVAQVASLRLRLIMQGKLNPDIDILLKTALTRHLVIGIEHASLWSHPDPDPVALAEAWDQQAQAMECWDIFMKMIEDSGFSIEQAYRFAFETYKPRKLSFNKAEERRVWTLKLKNEQQGDLLLSELQSSVQKSPEFRLDEDTLYYQGQTLKLSSLLGRIITMLWDELPYEASRIIYHAYGTKAYKDQAEKLSKRISELNGKLNEIWGKAPQGKWIRRIKGPNGSAYQLLKPSVK
jgi:hypothetical protein